MWRLSSAGKTFLCRGLTPRHGAFYQTHSDQYAVEKQSKAKYKLLSRARTCVVLQHRAGNSPRVTGNSPRVTARTPVPILPCSVTLVSSIPPDRSSVRASVCIQGRSARGLLSRCVKCFSTHTVSKTQQNIISSLLTNI